MKNLQQSVGEYIALIHGPCNAWGQHVHPRHGQSHEMLRYLYRTFGRVPVEAELTPRLIAIGEQYVG